MSTAFNFSGTWLKTQWHPNPGDDEEVTTVHRMVAHQIGDKLALESCEPADKSHATINLVVDGNIATGTWTDIGAPDGEYDGIVYTGAVQLLIDDAGAVMDGKWVGAGRHTNEDGSFEPRIYTGRCRLERTADADAADADARTDSAADDPATVTGTTES